jgi:hypothetical protein
MNLNALLLPIYLLLLDNTVVVSAKKQKICRLIPKSGVLTGQVPLAAPTSPAHPTTTRGANTATATASGATQTLAAFDYENKKVIGVNL